MIERVFSIEIKAPARRVWEEITATGVKCHPMFGTVLHATWNVGSTMSYRSEDGRHTFVAGKVLEVTPPNRLVHTFRFGGSDDPVTLVVWELAENAGVTRVTVTHSRFVGETKTYTSVTTGWPRILALFKARIETGTVPAGARFKHAMMEAMSFMLPKSMRTDNVLRLGTELAEQGATR